MTSFEDCGLLRHHFCKGTDLIGLKQGDLNAVALRVNSRPGNMSATIGRSADAHRRLPSTTPPAIVGMSIQPVIFIASPVSFRRTRTAATTSSTIPRARPGRSPPPCVGPTLAGSSSSWRISLPMPGAARRQRRSRRSRSKRPSASTPCSTSNAASMAKPPNSVCGFARNRALLGRLPSTAQRIFVGDPDLR